MDRLVQSTGTGAGTTSPSGAPCLASQVMDYYDGNTVTAMWNYAQHYSLGDNSFGVTFGPSAPGAINLASGDTGNIDTNHFGQQPVGLDTHLSPTATSRPTARAALDDQRRSALLG